jgi:predicted enzyme related to lactoylglutathione lyase
MLADKKIKAFIPTANPAKSKTFYNVIVGLDLLAEDDYGMEFNANGTVLRVNFVKELKPHPFTVLGWTVKDIASEIRSLNRNGITCERYQFLVQDHLGIWTSPNGTKVAWFNDPDGNILSLDE